MSGIRVELQLKDGSFTSGMLRAGQSVSSFRKELARVDPHFRKLDSTGRGVITTVRKADVVSRDFLSTLRDVSIVSGAVVMAFRGITGASGGIIGSITQVNAEMERLKYQMLGMSTSAEPLKEAAASVDYLRQKALQAPFSLNELATSFVKLKATGTDPMAGSLQAVADGIAAFGGTDQQLHRVTLGIVQMSGKSVIQMEEMRQQLGESMPNAMRIMARSMGVSVAELTKAISTGRVEASSALQSFYDELERTYGGEAQRMMETFSGQVSQLKANLQLLATGDGMKGFFEEQKAGLLELNQFLQSGEAKKFAKDVGNALIAMVRGIRIGVKAVYEFREELSLLIQVLAGGAALRLFGSAIVGLATRFNLAKLAMGGFINQLSSGLSMMRLGAQGLVTMQAAGTASSLVFTGLRAAVVGFGGALMVAAPWLAAIGTALALAGSQMGWFKSETDGAYESLRRYGAESRDQALQTLNREEYRLNQKLGQASEDLRHAHRRASYFQKLNEDEFNGKSNSPRLREYNDALKEYNDALKQVQKFQTERERILRETDEAEEDHSVRTYERQLSSMLREHNNAYNRRQTQLDKQHDKELAAAGKTAEDSFKVSEKYQNLSLENRKERSAQVIQTMDEELARLKKLQMSATDEDRVKALSRLIDFVNSKRVEAAREANSLGEFGISYVADIENEEAKIKRGSKMLDGLQSKIKGIQAELAGAGNAHAKLMFEIARGDYGSVEQGSDVVQKLHEDLAEAVAQKEALDKLMKGDRQAERDLDSIMRRAIERRQAAKEALDGKELIDAERYLMRLNSGFYHGLGPLENIKSGVEEVGIAFRDSAFGSQTVNQINTVNDALSATLGIVTNLKNGAGNISFGFSGGAPSGSGVFPVNGSMLDLIGYAEGTDKGRGYNETLDYGRWTGGDKNLTSMTIKQVLALQKQMLAHPENRAMYGNGKGSSALGRYQIVSKTLRGLVKEMGLSGDELFDENMQDRMATRLLARRGNSVVGLRQEWEGLKRISDEKIQAALTASNRVGPTRANAAKLNNSPGQNALIQNRVDETKKLQEGGREAARITYEAIADEEAKLRQDALKDLIAKKTGKDFEMEGLGKNYSAMIQAIQTGKLGRNTDINSDDYKEILEAAKELDEIEKQRAERKKATRQSDEKLKSLKREEEEITRRIADAQARIKDPDYRGQSNDLQKLIQDLDQYVERVKTAYGADSEEFRKAQSYRTDLIGKQKILDVTTRQSELAEETRSLRESMMSQSQLRTQQYERDLARVNQWVQDARAAGMEEVEITRQAEEMKKAIRDKYASETNPVTAQMEQWKDFSGTMMSKTTGWFDSLGSGVAGLITGTGDLRGAINGILSDVITAQVKFLWSNMAGGKTEQVGAMMGGKGKTVPHGPAGKGKAFPIAHTGGIAGGSLRTTRVDPSVFFNAPKFHTGGIVGAPRLKKDEIPIVAKKKEGIFTEEQMAALAPVGTGAVQMSVNAPITVNGSSGTPEQNNDLAKKMAREMEGTMRGVVVDEMRRQQRPGNLMNNRRR